MKWLKQLFGGPKDMTALPAGNKAPDFSLLDLNGVRFSLKAALDQGPVLAAFFKVSCPTCQYTFPFLERLHQAHANKARAEKKITVVGISQNNQRDTAAFLKEFGITFPTLLDDPDGYAVSNAYGLTNVPSLFLIGQDGEIAVTSVGWVKPEIEEINQKLSATQHIPPPPIFKAGEDVRDFRAG
jgi:peroxiredoxin